MVVACMVLLTGSNAAETGEGEPAVRTVQKWEYRVLTFRERRQGRAEEVDAREKSSEEQLNELGSLGWELVAVRENPDNDPVFYLKRPLRWVLPILRTWH